MTAVRRVAFVVGTTAGGTGSHVRMLAAGCAARGVPASVFGPARTDRDFGFSALPGVTFTAVEFTDRPRASDLAAVVRLRRLLADARADVVHAHGLRAGAFSALALSATWGTRTPAPAGRPPAATPAPAGRPPAATPTRRTSLIVTVHNAPAPGGVTGAVYRVLELIVARRADSVLCVSGDLEARMRAAGARRVARAIVPAPTRTPEPGPALESGPVPESGPAPEPLSDPMPHWVPPRGPEAPSGPRERRPVVLGVGRLVPQKGFGKLLDAAVSWREMSPEPVVVIAGEGPLAADLKNQAASLGVDAEFPGWSDDVPGLLAAAAVFVLPSTWEGQPLILQEALRAGVPIVASRAGGIPELTGQDGAVLVPPGDAGRIADAVRAVLEDPAHAARLRAAALRRAAALPSAEDAADAALAAYEAVIR